MLCGSVVRLVWWTRNCVAVSSPLAVFSTLGSSLHAILLVMDDCVCDVWCVFVVCVCVCAFVFVCLCLCLCVCVIMCLCASAAV